MSHGYTPQTSDISTKLYWTFFWGIVLGTALGYGIRGIMDGGGRPTEEQVAVSPAEGGGVQEAAPELAPPAGPFDADVGGLWPARHIFVGIEGTRASPETLAWLREFKPGGVVLGPDNLADPLQFAALVLQIKQAVGLGTTLKDPPFIVYRDSSQVFPAVAATLDRAAGNLEPGAKGAARAQARAARANGIGVFLAPSLDLYLPGVSAAAVGATALGDQPGIVAQRGLEYIRELRGGGVLSVATQFPGAGLAVPRSDGAWHIPAEQMDGLAAGMQPFQDAIEAGVPGLLVGHMAVPGIEADDPGRPASSSPKLLQLLLRDKLGFRGVVLAEDLGTEPNRATQPLDRIAVTALVSGCDAVILNEAGRDELLEICNALVRLARRDDFPTEQLAASKARLDDWQAQLAAVQAVEEQPAEVVTPVVVAKRPEVADAETGSPAEPGDGPATGGEMASEDVPRGDAKPEEIGETSGGEASVEDPAAEPATPDENEAAEEATETPGPRPEEATDEEAPAEAPAEAPEDAADSTPEDAAEDALFEEHTIERGDTLIALANRYGATVADLQAWNNLESQTIKFGYKLKVRPLNDAARKVAESGQSDEPSAEDGDGPDAPDPESPEAGEDLPSSEPPEGSEAMAETSPEPAPAEVEGGELALAGATPVEEPAAAAPGEPAQDPQPQPPYTDRREHAVAEGDTLPSVADLYGVTAAELAAWNGLDNDEAILEAGRRLVVYLPMAAEEADGDDTGDLAAVEADVAEPDPSTYVIHEVVAGDNLRRIALRYGVTQQAIIELNKLARPDHVQLGWKLKIPKPANGS